MRVLITGVAGFIGSAVIRHIINNTSHRVVNVDKLTYAGNLGFLKSIESDARYVFEQVDICDANEIKRVFNEYRPDVVMHLAAESHVDQLMVLVSSFKLILLALIHYLKKEEIIGLMVLIKKQKKYLLHQII